MIEGENWSQMTDDKFLEKSRTVPDSVAAIEIDLMRSPAVQRIVNELMMRAKAGTACLRTVAPTDADCSEATRIAVFPCVSKRIHLVWRIMLRVFGWIALFLDV